MNSGRLHAESVRGGGGLHDLGCSQTLPSKNRCHCLAHLFAQQSPSIVSGRLPCTFAIVIASSRHVSTARDASLPSRERVARPAGKRCLFLKNRLWYRVCSLKLSGNGQFNPACLAFFKYSPAVLLETLQTRAMARLEKPSFLNRNTSRIFRTGNRSWGISISFS